MGQENVNNDKKQKNMLLVLRIAIDGRSGRPWPFDSAQGPARRGALNSINKPPAGLNARLIV